MLSVAREPKPQRDEVLSLEVLAGRAPQDETEEPSEFRVLVRHFLERFFNNELASAEGDAKTRLVQVACTIGILALRSGPVSLHAVSHASSGAAVLGAGGRSLFLRRVFDGGDGRGHHL